MTELKRKYLIVIPTMAALVILVVAGWARREMSRTLEAQLTSDLEAALSANVTAMEIWMQNQERMAEVIANEPEVYEAAQALLQRTATGVWNATNLRQLPEQIAFRDVMDRRLSKTGYGVAGLIAPNRIILGTSSLGQFRVGQTLWETQSPFLEETLAMGKPMVMPPTKIKSEIPAHVARIFPESTRPGFQATNVGLMQIIAPVQDEGGRSLAGLAFVVRPEEEFTRVLSVARSGQTGEAFAFDRDGLMISESRFTDQLKSLGLLPGDPDAQSALNLELRDPGGDLTAGFRPDDAGASSRPLTRMVADAVQGGTGMTLEPTRDYRGVKVVGAWRWLPDRHFGIVTKIDAQEAFRPLRVLRSLFILLLTLLIIATVASVLISYRHLVLRRRFDAAQLEARQLGQYTLSEKIGEGAMGVVYRAHHAMLRRETAVKLLLPDRADPELIRQFEHEVRLTCQLSHPNTIQVYDYGRTPDGIFYYAMELLHGVTLAQLVERHGPQPEGRVLHLLTQICGSLSEAHAAGLIHRDIKPGNIFLCRRGGIPDTVKVLDFGLVRSIREDSQMALPAGDEPKKSRFLGTPLFMAPEIIRHPAGADPRSDIYAVGGVAYYLLTGEHVFNGRTVTEVLQHHLGTTPEPPSRRRKQPLSPPLEALIMRCLEKDPARRPQTVAALQESLRACPAIAAWTFEERSVWWRQHGEVEAPSTRPPVEPRLSGAPGATLKVDFSHRQA